LPPAGGGPGLVPPTCDGAKTATARMS
jgi:hypothetical protein